MYHRAVYRTHECDSIARFNRRETREVKLSGFLNDVDQNKAFICEVVSGIRHLNPSPAVEALKQYQAYIMSLKLCNPLAVDLPDLALLNRCHEMPSDFGLDVDFTDIHNIIRNTFNYFVRLSNKGE